MLEGGLTALAIAPAGYAAAGDREIATIGVLRGTADEAAIETAFSIAERLDAAVVDCDRGVDLLVVGSRPEARAGRVMITSRAANAIEEATSPVLIVARGVALRFETLVTPARPSHPGYRAPPCARSSSPICTWPIAAAATSCDCRRSASGCWRLSRTPASSAWCCSATRSS